ncbi:MAG TPA: VWA domain-containing protein [Candidatus Dormibacteraeota bacterium]|nr:VWA domain-containing protein [Candidatus Dormibacteraeota bacterium]
MSELPGVHRAAGEAGDPAAAAGIPDPLARVALFARLLRDAGMRTGPDRLVDAVAALGCVDAGSREQVRDALRAVFVGRHEEAEVYDAAFDLFWSDPTLTAAAGSIPQRGRSLPVDPERAREWMAALALPSSQMGREQDQPAPVSSSGYSAGELLRQRDFRDMTWEETLAVRRLLRQAPWRVAERRTRRRHPQRRGAVDLRRTMRIAARQGGDAMHLARARPRLKRRPLVILCDVSGSMDRYSRQLLVFAHAVGHRQRVETFAFSTRLTRITHLLRRGDVDEALDHIATQVHDIGGGTRIGSALHDFNRRYARRVLGHGAVVLLISDGWDRGDVGELAAEMAWLHRSCHRLIWLNPLLGAAGYAPETRGMRAALPYCDDFLAANDVNALDELGRLLASLPARVSRTGAGGAAVPAAGA